MPVTSKEFERRKEQFNDIVANIKPFNTIGKGRSQKTIIGSAVVPLSCCYVDSRYQGMRRHKNLKRLENNFDIRKLTPIVLVPHYEEYRFAIVDGQGRYLVAPKKDMDRLNAIILMDAPEDVEERLKFEAEYFIGQDDETEIVKPVEKHPARVIIGDEAATIVDELLHKYNIKFVSESGQRECSVLGSYKDAYTTAKVHGKECLDFAFGIITNAGWDKETNGYSTFVMRSLINVWVAHPEHRKKMYKFLSNYLRQLYPGLFSSYAKTEYPKRDARVSCALYVEDVVCNALGIPKKIYLEDNKFVMVK